MVFNWFRRQFGTSDASAQETRSETPQVEQEQKALEKPEEEPTDEESTKEQSSAVAEDYLNWAKAAYKNIHKQQQSEEDASTAAEPVSETQEEVSTTETTDAATEDNSAPVETTVAESEEEAIAEAEEPATAPLADQVVETSAPKAEAPPDVAAAQSQEEAAPPEAETISESPTTVEATDSEEETAAPVVEEPVAVEAEAPSSAESAVPPETVESADVEVATKAPVGEEPAAVESETVAPAAVKAEEASAGPVPIWARNAERQARLERLKETAIELPEPEPVRAPVQPVAAAATTTVEGQEIPGLAFDEGFLWSSQVLAAQGRRPEDVSVEEISWLKRLRQGLDKTRRSLINQLKAIVGQGPLNQDAVMEIEALLLQADVGVEATDYIINTLQQQLREEVLPPEQAIAYLKQILRDVLDRPYQESYSPTFVPE